MGRLLNDLRTHYITSDEDLKMMTSFLLTNQEGSTPNNTQV